MTRLRKRIAERLKEAQNTAAILTTFNEADMSAVMALRKQYRDSFEKKHGVRLGFMSFFIKASIAALQELPSVNGEIDGDEIVYKNHYDIGIAVGTPQGLVVPVIRDADRLGPAVTAPRRSHRRGAGGARLRRGRDRGAARRQRDRRARDRGLATRCCRGSRASASGWGARRTGLPGAAPRVASFGGGR